MSLPWCVCGRTIVRQTKVVTMAKWELFFYQKLLLLEREVVTFFNLSKFMTKEIFLEKGPTSRNNSNNLQVIAKNERKRIVDLV